MEITRAQYESLNGFYTHVDKIDVELNHSQHALDFGSFPKGYELLVRRDDARFIILPDGRMLTNKWAEYEHD